MINLDLSGKRAVVTGASLGIGAAIVTTLAEHGAQVEFCARSADAVRALTTDKNIVGHTADMGNQESTENFISGSSTLAPWIFSSTTSVHHHRATSCT